MRNHQLSKRTASLYTLNSLYFLFIYFFLTSTFACDNIIDFDGTSGPGIENGENTPGKILKFIPRGGRLIQFHRGYLYIMGEAKSMLWDVSSTKNPIKLRECNFGGNGHRWYKLNQDLFFREYSVPELKDAQLDAGLAQFLDLSDMASLQPWLKPLDRMPISNDAAYDKWQRIETFPTNTLGGIVRDSRYTRWDTNPDARTSTFDIGSLAVSTDLRFRIGNLLFITGNGLSVLDIGDPANVRILDSFKDQELEQYTTTYHVWGHKVVMLKGTRDNKGGNSLVTIDFSDPTNLKIGHFNHDPTHIGLPVEKISTGRYMYFQDKYGFTGNNLFGVKIDMEKGEVVQKFQAPGWPEVFMEYQWMPMGSQLIASGANIGGEGKTFFIQHQQKPDKKGPEVRFHHPFNNSTNNPISTVIGFSIPEIIDEQSATDTSIIVQPDFGGGPIEGDITWTSYQVLNFIPKHDLLDNTRYKVTLVKNGLKDIAGNGTPGKTFYFSTGTLPLGPQIVRIDKSFASDPEPISVGENVSFGAVAYSPQNENLEYRWLLSELRGTTGDTWSTSKVWRYTFESPGLFNVTLQARDESGNITTKALTILVVDKPTSTQPAHASQMAFTLETTGEKRRLATVNPDNNTLTLINLNNLTKFKEIAVCNDPVSVASNAVAGSQKNLTFFWVVCRDDDRIFILDNQGQVIKKLNLQHGASPINIVSNPLTQNLFVGESGTHKITKILASNFSTTSLTLPGKPRALAILPDKKQIFVSQFVSQGDNGKVWRLNTQSLTLQKTITLQNDTNTIDAGSSSRGSPNYLFSIALEPSGKKAWVTGKKDNILRGLQRDGNALSFENTVRSLISPIDIENSKEIFAKRVDIDNNSLPVAAAFSTYGSHLFLAMQGNNRIVILDPNSGHEIIRVNVKDTPQALLFEPTTQQLFVKNFLDRSISVFNLHDMVTQGLSHLTPFSDGDISKTIKTVNTEKLDEQVLEGKRIFYDSEDARITQDGYLSCAACHDDGHHDGRVWDFTDRGEGLRNTISLQGHGGLDQGRLHWSANFDEIQDFEHDIRRFFLGTGLMADSKFLRRGVDDPLGSLKAGFSSSLDALAAYLQSLKQFPRSPHRQKDGVLTAEAKLGKKHFIEQGCNMCHYGNAFSDSPSGQMHDVGTITKSSGQRLGKNLPGIDTPTLRGLWATAPYLHDGSAKTLNELIAVSGPRHGDMKKLSDQHKKELMAYLLSIDGDEPPIAKNPLELEVNSLIQGENIFSDAVPLTITSNMRDIQKVDYYANGYIVAQSNTAPFNKTWKPNTPYGTYRIAAKVFRPDNQPNTLSPEKIINVNGDGSCFFNFTIRDEWDYGYQADIELINMDDSAIQGFELKWQLSKDESVERADGKAFTVTNQIAVINASGEAPWSDGYIEANGGSKIFSVGIKISIAKNTAATPPRTLLLNNRPCTPKHLM